MVGNLLLANAVCLFFRTFVILGMLHILGVGNTDHLLKRRSQLVIGDFLDARNHFAKLHTAGGFHNDKIPGSGPIGAGVEKIELSSVLKANANYFNHG